MILAIDEMLKNGATSYNYLDKILKSWESKGLDSVEKAQKYIDGYYQSNKKQRGSNRKETLPDWAIEQEKEREEAERKRNENNEQLEARKREILKEYGL